MPGGDGAGILTGRRSSHRSTITDNRRTTEEQSNTPNGHQSFGEGSVAVLGVIRSIAGIHDQT
jgi:hypothetical protein